MKTLPHSRATLVVALTLLAGTSVLAAPRATKAQCAATCDSTGSTDAACDWVVLAYAPRQQGRKFAVCRAILLRQCRKWGTAAICPAVAPPPPTTTTTTLPAAPLAPPTTTTTTTTLRPVPPPTTTTLPPPPRVANWIGAWTFTGTLQYNTCPTSLTSGYEQFSIGQAGTALSATTPNTGSVQLTGTIEPTGNFSVHARLLTDCAGIALEAHPGTTLSVSSTPAAMYIATGCGAVECDFQYVGTLSR